MAYTFVVMVTIIYCFCFFCWCYREKVHSARISLAGLAAGGTTIVVAYTLIILIAPELGGFTGQYDQGLRYCIPLLIAGVPLTFSIDYIWSLNNSFRFKLCMSTISLLFGIFILIFFSESLKDRINQAYHSGSILAFSTFATSDEYINYNEVVLQGDTRLRIVNAQKHIPAGQSMVAFIMTPFYLDYKRNVIYDAEFNGLISPWAYMPNVDYFIVEYKGFAIAPSFFSQRCVAFYLYLAKIANSADLLYNDGRIVVFKKHRDNVSDEIMIKDLPKITCFKTLFPMKW
ncbi:MAG TPA: hypothetical protein VMU29_04540 [Smithella sp.]|nr:hypothetical protein [Smithella sp.]